MDNNGPLGAPDYTNAVLYYNTSPSEPNPPSLLLEIWVDGTGGLCPTAKITTLTGEVQDNVLGIDNNYILRRQISMYINPSSDILHVESSIHKFKNVEIYSLLGEKISDISSNFDYINLFSLLNGMYLVQIETINGAILVKKLLIN